MQRPSLIQHFRYKACSRYGVVVAVTLFAAMEASVAVVLHILDLPMDDLPDTQFDGYSAEQLTQMLHRMHVTGGTSRYLWMAAYDIFVIIPCYATSLAMLLTAAVNTFAREWLSNCVLLLPVLIGSLDMVETCCQAVLAATFPHLAMDPHYYVDLASLGSICVMAKFRVLIATVALILSGFVATAVRSVIQAKGKLA